MGGKCSDVWKNITFLTPAMEEIIWGSNVSKVETSAIHTSTIYTSIYTSSIYYSTKVESIETIFQ